MPQDVAAVCVAIYGVRSHAATLAKTELGAAGPCLAPGLQLGQVQVILTTSGS